MPQSWGHSAVRLIPLARLSACVLALCALAAPGLAAPTPHAEGLRVESSAEGDRLWLTYRDAAGRLRTSLLRESSGGLRPAHHGSDPARAAHFATWTEGGETWYRFSRDGGSSWSAPRTLERSLRLRSGRVSPTDGMPRVASGLSLAPEARVFLVQFRTASLPEWRDALRQLGGEVLAFFPHNAHLVRLDPGVRGTIGAMDFVERIEPYHPAYRLEEALQEWLDADGPDQLPVRVQVFEWGPVGKRRVVEAAEAAGARVAEWWPSGHVVELVVNRDQLRMLAGHDDVMWIDRWTERSHDMDVVREDSGANFVESIEGYCGQGVRGEVLDNGMQLSHDDFDGIIAHGANSQASHGTSSYGVVFGNGDRDGDGNGQATGNLPCAEQGFAADYDHLLDRFVHTQELKSAPYFASFQTNSWGNAQVPNYTSVSSELDDIVWRLDIAIFNSQSNTGNQNSRPQAWGKNVISVGGIFHQNTLDPSDDEWDGGASIGPAEDGRIKPDIHYWYDDIFTTTTGNGYTQFGGTSAATPESAGILGLMLQMWGDNVWGTDPVGSTVFEKQPHFSTMKALLVNNAQQYDFSGVNDDLTRTHQGWGRPSAQLAYERAARSFILDEEVLLEVGEAVSYEIDVDFGESELKVTMVYPDPPGTTSSALHRINNLDLRVLSPSGVEYHGNVGLDVGTHSTPGGSPNGVDTVENVFLLDPEPGTWTVEISAPEVNQDAYLNSAEDDVAFALVVTGGQNQVCGSLAASFLASSNPGVVGQPISFDATATGGAGGPYAFEWDFDDDGRVDSIDEDPVHVYNRPYDGPVRLRVLDSTACPETESDTLVINGPDLVFDSEFERIEVEGNGNGKLDPGETWDIRVRLRNDGNQTASGVRSRLEVDPTSPGPIAMLAPTATFPDIAAGETGVSNEAYRFRVGDGFTCGEEAVLTMVGLEIDSPRNRFPDQVGVLTPLVGGSGAPVLFYADNFESNNGWNAIGDGEWQWGAPQGLGGRSSFPGEIAGPDPTSAFEGSGVMGNDLTGQGARPGAYEANIESRVTSTGIDLSGAAESELRFARWVNTGFGDTIHVEVSNNNFSWLEVFAETAGQFIEQAWTQHSYDVSAVGDGSPGFRVRFRIESDGVGQQGGWNVDDLQIFGVTRDSCTPFAATEPGETYDLRVDRGAPGELVLSWGGDCGGGSSFGVYRGDLAVGYSSLGLDTCGVAGTSVTIGEGAGAADFFLVVPDDGASEGSYGSDSSGARTAPAGACLPQGTLSSCVP